MTKRILSFMFFALFVSVGLRSENLKVVLANGDEVVFAFVETPVLRYSHTTMFVTTSSRCVEIPIFDLVRFDIEHVPTSGISALEDVVATSLSGPLVVYSVDGKLVRTFADGKIDSNELPKGIFVVKQGRHSYKIAVN